MRDVELYRHLLEMEPPWIVTRVEVIVKEQRIDVWVGHREGLYWPCPECGRELPVYDHSETWAWRHLESCRFLGRRLAHSR